MNDIARILLGFTAGALFLAYGIQMLIWPLKGVEWKIKNSPGVFSPQSIAFLRSSRHLFLVRCMGLVVITLAVGAFCAAFGYNLLEGEWLKQAGLPRK
jgi:branched-subunit amino acid transport protein